jgi:transposase
MMGRLKHDQGQFFYSFRLDEAVPGDHPIRQIASVLDLSWVHLELAPFYPNVGRPSIDPELMIRMLIVGYVFAIRSERALCRDVQVNLAYRWFCGLSIEDKVPDHSAFSRARHERFRDSDIFRRVFEPLFVKPARCPEAGAERAPRYAAPQTGLRHISDRSRVYRNGNWKMVSRDWRRKATSSEPKVRNLPARDSGAPA